MIVAKASKKKFSKAKRREKKERRMRNQDRKLGLTEDRDTISFSNDG